MSPHRNNNKSIGSANEEWAEILNVAPHEASSYTTRLSLADPTPTEVEVNKSLSAQDLQSLKEQDPFLYYSIPGVRDATVRLENVDMHQIAQHGLRRGCQSCPASIQNASTSEHVAKVKRCTRVSFECHTDLLLDLDDLSDEHSAMGKALEEDLSLGRLDDFLLFSKLFERS